MIKNIIAPVQSWLLSQQRCVGCGMLLSQGKKEIGKAGETVICSCKRIYIYNPGKKTYRRALMSEI